MTPRNLTILLLLFLFATSALCDDKKDAEFDKLYQRYYRLYSDSDANAFYKASNQLKTYYQKSGNSHSYYKLLLNEVLYDSDHGRTYKAIQKANNMLEIMKEKGDNYYNLVYSAMGNIYKIRGNYRMSDYYFTNALKNCSPNDTNALADVYPRLAELKANREPDKAWNYNEKFGAIAKNNPEYYKMYLVLKSEICFYLNNWQRFSETYKEYDEHCKKHPNLLEFGNTLMSVLNNVYKGNYETALDTLNTSTNTVDFTDLDRCDLRIKIYEMMGNREMALKEVTNRRDLRDSLNSNMLFESINEINAQMGLARMNEKAAKEREVWLASVIVLLLVALGLVVSRSFMRRRYQKQLLKKNKELEIALSRAEESDRMKDSFIEHVSHEIRTPLNVITGYAQIITNPAYELEDEERNRMLQDISHNTDAITNIVNELLEVAEDESREHYPKSDTINVNDFCRKIMKWAEQGNHEHLRLTFDTELSDDFTFCTNLRALEKVMEQLMSNALKFTQEGGINLRVHQSPDHGMIRFIVTDTGIGIAKEHRQHIFERFFKVDSFKQGFGLGLTMSQKMAILLDGSLFLDNTYTNGSRFILTLPA